MVDRGPWRPHQRARTPLVTARRRAAPDTPPRLQSHLQSRKARGSKRARGVGGVATLGYKSPPFLTGSARVSEKRQYDWLCTRQGKTSHASTTWGPSPGSPGTSRPS